ncbi:protein BTG1 [Elysia marginata]|uniref:Protein BTG1 n=1 Tax=Elysia marginata TaxID=1093978 RepID=A0AAV4F8G5_9GAST|nr:protein BTG1 [Elysia marginata]
MRKEISKAVDIFHKIAFKNLDSKKIISESQINLFLSVFTELLVVKYEKFWFPDDPERASGFRCIRVNQQSIDPVVAESLCKAGFPRNQHKQIISHEVTVWVDPGVVSMRIGEDGSVGHEVVDEQLYAKNMAKRGCSPKPRQEHGDAEIDEGFGSRSPSPPDTPSSLSSNDYSTPSRRPNHLRKSPPPHEYNPYAMSAQVCNAGRRGHLHQAMAQTRANQVLQQQPNLSPMTNLFSPSSSAQPQGSRPFMPPSSGMMAPPPSSGALYHTSGNIPGPATSLGSSPFPSARRNVFGECGGMAQDNFGKMATRDYHAMAMNYHGNMNYMDIPVVA